MRPRFLALATAIIASLGSPVTFSAEDTLEQQFISPPESAKPRVWWQWLDGNVTQDGISADLQWMHRVGIAGVENFEAAFVTPRVTERRLIYMSAPWSDAFRHAVTLSEQLGMDFGIASGPGYSAAGGPWVTPALAMKKLVWTETRVVGGHLVNAKVAQPSGIPGPFQNIPAQRTGPTETPKRNASLYRDVAVIAYRISDDDRELTELGPKWTSSAGELNPASLWDGDLTTSAKLPFGESGQSAWIRVDFGHPETIRSMTLALEAQIGFTKVYTSAELQCSQDGLTYRTITKLESTRDVQQTVGFEPTTARYFRLVLPTPPPPSVPSAFAAFTPPARNQHEIAEFQLHTAARLDHFERKAGFFIDQTDYPLSSDTSDEAIRKSAIYDLTHLLSRDGTLHWNAPPGRWVILRLGYSPLGTINRPAPAEATGLVVDRLNRKAVTLYLDQYLNQYQSVLGKDQIGRHGIRSIFDDSWEGGPQNWTDDLPREFAERRGYDMRLWMPALTGRIISSTSATERFLWDFRRTLEELVVDNYYATVSKLLHKHGLTHYGESHEVGRAFLGDGIDVKAMDDMPMGAMWTKGDLPLELGGPPSQEDGDADLLESASAAHIYGHTLVGAESMTTVGTPYAAFAFSPAQLKSTADREMADGVNRFFIHTSVHQPLNKWGPGVSLGPYGQWFTRNETWAGQAKAWTTYLARSSYLLQQGKFVADFVYYYGSDSNITSLFGAQLPTIPEGYAFDFASSRTLTRFSVRDGSIVSPGNTQYRLLVLDPRTRIMPLDALQQIGRLVAAGATVVGSKPTRTPSLADNEVTFRSLADSIWGPDGTQEHRYGRGQVISRRLEEVLSKLAIEPDFSYSKSAPEREIKFLHRHLNESDIYFIDNREDQIDNIEASFRVRGRKVPAIWHADSGSVEPVSYHESGTRTVVPMVLNAQEAVFVVFRKAAGRPTHVVQQPVPTVIDSLSGPWEVQFQSNDSPRVNRMRLSKLDSWSTFSDPQIKYFSGTAIYDTILNVPDQWIKDRPRLEIDLGAVKEVAEVIVENRSAGVVWHAPYKVDVTQLLKPGANHIIVRVANLWVNRLIGDKQPNMTPVAFTTDNPYTKDSPLLESGLLGPVTLLSVKPVIAANY